MAMRDFNAIMEEFLKGFLREDAVKVYRGLLNRRNVSEFDIAEELGLNINAVRNILYSLHEHNLVYSIRKKDKEKGWYIYYWTLNMRYAKDVLLKKKGELLRSLNKQLLDEENKTFYKCPDNHVRLSLEEAMDCGFKCVDCEKVLIEESKKSLPNTKKIMEQIEGDIKILNDYEVKEIEETKEKEKKTRIKKAVKKKSAKKGKKAVKLRKRGKHVSKKKDSMKRPKKRVKITPKRKLSKKKEDTSPKKGILGKIRKKVRRLSF